MNKNTAIKPAYLNPFHFNYLYRVFILLHCCCRVKRRVDTQNWPLASLVDIKSRNNLNCFSILTDGLENCVCLLMEF